jgi:hypothetical protein
VSGVLDPMTNGVPLGAAGAAVVALAAEVAPPDAVVAGAVVAGAAVV